MPANQDLTGLTFGRLTVSGYSHTASKKRFWSCKCECGEVSIVPTANLHSGNTQSCGCFQDETKGAHSITHGETRGGVQTSLYNRHRAMMARCYDPSSVSYARYGAKGISVCAEWHEFEKFAAWARSSGYDPKLSIDRIDGYGDYNPGNCRWVDGSTQARNRSSNRFIEHEGRKLTAAQWADEKGIAASTILHRLNAGWTTVRALTEPVYKARKRKGRG